MVAIVEYWQAAWRWQQLRKTAFAPRALISGGGGGTDI